MSKVYGIGIVGCGMISAFHARAIADMKNARLVAVFSRSPEKAGQFAARHGCQAFSDYGQFLACDGLDIVAIATPSGKHLEPALAAARAGKHVLCEKPIEATLERADEIIRACDENNVRLSGIFPRRFNGAVEAVKQAVDEGRLGRITLASAYIKWHRTQAYYDQDIWRRTWALSGGGALMNQSIHTIDLLLYFAGDVESVCAFAGCSAHANIEVEDIAVAVLKFKNGAMGTIEGTTTAYSPTGHPAQVQLCGTDGSIFLSDNTLTAWDFMQPRDTDRAVLERHGARAGAQGVGAADPKAIDYVEHLRNFEDFVASLESGAMPRISGPESRRAIEVILAIYASALDEGKRVHLPLSESPRLRSLG